MPEETPVVDCHKCAGLEFARNLARSMKEGYGRHNSRRDFQHVPTDLLEAIAVARQVSRQRREWRENQQARVIGRIGDNSLRERWQDCEIGDAVPEAKMPQAVMANTYGSRYIVIRRERPPRFRFRPDQEYEMAQTTDVRFEKVRHQITSDRGQTWQEEIFWKRIE